jgi:hypothetical protein
MPEPRYRVHHLNADAKLDWSFVTDRGEEAFGHFLSSLRTVSTSENWIEMRLTQLTIAMMEGRSQFTALDPDLQGSTSFTRTATN